MLGTDQLFLFVLLIQYLLLGQAKLIIRFQFQGFQNSMRAGSHFSLFIMTKILRKQCKKPTIMKILYIFENQCGANSHIMKILWYLQKACRRKWESNNQLCLALAGYISEEKVSTNS